MKKVSGYSTRSDPKACTDTVLAGRRFHSRTVPGKKEFDSIWSLIRSWNVVFWYARRRFGGTCLRWCLHDCCGSCTSWRAGCVFDAVQGDLLRFLIVHSSSAIWKDVLEVWTAEKIKNKQVAYGAFCLNLKRCKMRRRFIISNFHAWCHFQETFSCRILYYTLKMAFHK